MLQTRNPIPRSNEFSSYPYLFSYACLPLFVADYAAARATGRAASAEQYAEDAAAHLERFHLLGRIVAAFGGAVAAAATVVGGTLLAGSRAGILAGLLAALGPLTLLLSLHERPWSWVLACISIAAAGAIAAIRDPKATRPLVVSALAAGAAGGFHQVGAA